MNPLHELAFPKALCVKSAIIIHHYMGSDALRQYAVLTASTSVSVLWQL